MTRYLHKFHNAPSMARLRSLSRAAVAPNGNDEAAESPQTAVKECEDSNLRLITYSVSTLWRTT